jgi:hypothetical protein
MPTFNVRSGRVPADHLPPTRDEQVRRLFEGFARNVEIDRDERTVEITFVKDAKTQTAFAIAERALSEFAGTGAPWAGGTVVSRAH